MTWDTDHAVKMAEIYRGLLVGQKPLGADFEKVWDNHTDELYEN